MVYDETMKPQDVLFFVVFAFLSLRKPHWLLYGGLLCLVLAIPLFSLWIFFTAERLTWYAAAFFLSFILISLFKPHKVQ